MSWLWGPQGAGGLIHFWKEAEAGGRWYELSLGREGLGSPNSRLLETLPREVLAAALGATHPGWDNVVLGFWGQGHGEGIRCLWELGAALSNVETGLGRGQRPCPEEASVPTGEMLPLPSDPSSAYDAG